MHESFFAHEEPDATSSASAAAGPGAFAAGAGRLVALNGPLAGTIFPISRRDTRIGRSKHNDIVLDVPTTSRHHASVRFDGSRYYLVDAGASNGTWLDERKVQRSAALRPGQVIRLGEQRLRFEMAGAGHAAEWLSHTAATRAGFITRAAHGLHIVLRRLTGQVRAHPHAAPYQQPQGNTPAAPAAPAVRDMPFGHQLAAAPSNRQRLTSFLLDPHDLDDTGFWGPLVDAGEQ